MFSVVIDYRVILRKWKSASPPCLISGSMIRFPVVIWRRLTTRHLTHAVNLFRFGAHLLIISERKWTRLQRRSRCWFMCPSWASLHEQFIWTTFEIKVVVYLWTVTMCGKFPRRRRQTLEIRLIWAWTDQYLFFWEPFLFVLFCLLFVFCCSESVT